MMTLFIIRWAVVSRGKGRERERENKNQNKEKEEKFARKEKSPGIAEGCSRLIFFSYIYIYSFQTLLVE